MSNEIDAQIADFVKNKPSSRSSVEWTRAQLWGNLPDPGAFPYKDALHIVRLEDNDEANNHLAYYPVISNKDCPSGSLTAETLPVTFKVKNLQNGMPRATAEELRSSAYRAMLTAERAFVEKALTGKTPREVDSNTADVLRQGILDAEHEMAVAGPHCWIVGPELYRKLRSMPVDPGSGRFLLEGDAWQGVMLGTPRSMPVDVPRTHAFVSTNLGGNVAVFLHCQRYLFVEWPTVRIEREGDKFSFVARIAGAPCGDFPTIKAKHLSATVA